MESSNNNLFSGHFEGNLFSGRFVIDGLQTKSVTNKEGFRCHNFITSLFVGIFGSGIIDIQTKNGTVYLNKGSIKNLLIELNDSAANSNDNNVLRQALQTLLKEKKIPQHIKNEGNDDFFVENNNPKKIEENVFISIEAFESSWLENNATQVETDCLLVKWDNKNVQSFWGAHVEKGEDLKKTKIFIEETFRTLSDKEIAGIIEKLLKEKPTNYLEKIAIAVEQIREPFDCMVLLDLFSESASEDELVMNCAILKRLNTRLEQEKNLSVLGENASEGELQFQRETTLKTNQWKEIVEKHELICNNCFTQNFIHLKPKNPFLFLQKINLIAPQIIENNKVTYLFSALLKYNMNKQNGIDESWKNCLKLLYERILLSKTTLSQIKLSSYKTKFEEIRNIVAPKTNIPW